LIGLSNVDYQDASENTTSSTMDFKNHRWYRIRIRVTDAAIEAWIDDQKLVDQPRKDHAFGIRMECELSRPLGVSTWGCSGAVRKIRVRALPPAEVRAVEDQQKRAADGSSGAGKE
jgi:hypothetical protein